MSCLESRLIQKNGVKILFVAEIRGALSQINAMARDYEADVVIHTGNFGFFDDHSVERIHESYLRHIVEFSPLLSHDLLTSISELSKVHGDNVEHLSNDKTNLRSLLIGNPISELREFLAGSKRFEVPVYTVSGMCEDSAVLNKFKYGIYSVPNLHIIDEDHIFNVKVKDGSEILFFGLGGSLSYHKLFHHGTAIDLGADVDDTNILPISGDPGNIWITMLQLGKLIDNLSKFAAENADLMDKSVKFFVTHQSPAREPLLEHLSIFFKADYTVSNGLHFKYPSSYNELSINPNFENFKYKFNESRLRLSIIWSKISKEFLKLLDNIADPTELQNLVRYSSLALDVYDKIPVSAKNHEEILPIKLDLSAAGDPELAKLQVGTSFDDSASGSVLSSIIRQLNDLYYLSFQNTWHYNLCDASYGLLEIELLNGNFTMKTHSRGFDFDFRKRAGVRSGSSSSDTNGSSYKEDQGSRNADGAARDKGKASGFGYRGARGSSRGRGGRGSFPPRGRGRGRGGSRGSGD